MKRIVSSRACRAFPPWMPFLFAALVSAALPAAAQSSFSDDSHWDPRFSPPSPFANVTNIQATRDYLIISGYRYDGSSTTIATVYGPVGSMALSDLSISGWEEASILTGETRIFGQRGSAEGDLAELDLEAGTATAIPNPPGTSPPLATYGDVLYALPEGQPFRLSGEAWDSLGPSIGFAVYRWAVGPQGIFAAVGPGSICGVADRPDCNTSLWQLAAGQWQQIGLAIGTGNPPVSGLAVDGQGRLTIAGDFIEVSGVSTPRVARWDGSEWSGLGSGFGSEMGFITDLVAADTNLYASGNLILEWDGSSWDVVGGRPAAFVRSLAAGNGHLFASGWFTAIGETAAYRVAEWNSIEGRWRPVFPIDGAGIDGEVTALAAGADGSIFAAGFFSAAGDVAATNIARWDSLRWWSVGSGLPDYVSSVTVGSSKIYAGTHQGVATADLDNPSWSYLPGLPDGSELRDVQDVLLVSDTLYAVARSGQALVPNGVYRFVGNEWEAIGEFLAGSQPGLVNHLAVDDLGVLYAAGAFDRVGGVPASGVARWSDGQWQTLGDGIEGYVSAMATGGGQVYAAAGLDGVVVQWDPTTQEWTGIPPPPRDFGTCFTEVLTLHWRRDGLYAGFLFFCAVTKRETANDQIPTLMRWDGDVWEIPGAGIHGGTVNALVSSGHDLYAGGNFRMAGGRPAASFARWNESVVLEVEERELPVGPLLDQNYPNPFNSLTTVRFALERPAAHARLEIYDQLGRQVATLLDSSLGPGPHEVSFDSAGLAAGIYLYRLSVDGRAAAKRMVVIR